MVGRCLLWDFEIRMGRGIVHGSHRRENRPAINVPHACSLELCDSGLAHPPLHHHFPYATSHLGRQIGGPKSITMRIATAYELRENEAIAKKHIEEGIKRDLRG
ncbi:hypothetical protein DM860_013404 [Cuscuta australis]|uniref:Uncharacterized protein n=1 Tax=Cuscuta australis TaxID=267555 RepID=A0A328DSR8_9ASTE|nr:hypothetical protein DM860_013404 [Cuscuta australis]